MNMEGPIDYCKKQCPSNYQYKRFATGGNDPHISCKMRYANLVNNTKNLNRIPVSTCKDQKTGNETPTTSSVVKHTYSPKGIFIGKTVCVNNNN